MAYYLLSFGFAPETIKNLVAKPEDRRAAASKALEALGCKLHQYFFAFGKHDAIVIVECPDNTAATAVAMLTGSTGSFSHVETTPLITMDEAVAAMKKAGKASASYRPPGR
ncbi:MAG: GYD domain-containing protein [Proteobacteria bacterium]|nr:GYD domain-containing protein [Pseudomonadota bacterium]MBI3500126.1 GYD domain-containing protein [Pseudomonadota bacterium]